MILKELAVNWGAFWAICVVMGIAFLGVQRADPTKRGAVRAFMGFSFVLVGLYAGLQGVWLSAVFGVLAALLFNLLFWVLIGRYNPVASSDDIHVFGMDD
ncbi:MAG: hypothetical protein ACOYL5_00990 [Phototrophicaceae bacterium]